MKILAIESSCDETAAAVVENGRTVLSSVVNTQIEEHKKYGGVVPEIASRRHTENICGVVEKALSDAGLALPEIDAVAVTAARDSSAPCWWVWALPRVWLPPAGKPLIPVNHLRGHIAANYIGPPRPGTAVPVSGGVGRSHPYH